MRWIGILLVLGLAGCYGGDQPSGGGYGLPQVSMRNSSETIVPPGRGTLALAVRTFVPAGEGWNELDGVQCRVTGGGYFGANVVTPVRLTVQDLGPDAPPLRADCVSGNLKGTDVVAPTFGWPTDTRPGGAHRFWWGKGWWWGYQRTGPMHYPDLAVSMR